MKLDCRRKKLADCQFCFLRVMANSSAAVCFWGISKKKINKKKTFLKVLGDGY